MAAVWPDMMKLQLTSPKFTKRKKTTGTLHLGAGYFGYVLLSRINVKKIETKNEIEHKLDHHMRCEQLIIVYTIYDA